MIGLTWDGTPNPSRETKFSGVNGDSARLFFFCSIDHEQGWHSYAVDPSSAESADNTICSSFVCDGGRGCGKEVRQAGSGG